MEKLPGLRYFDKLASTKHPSYHIKWKSTEASWGEWKFLHDVNKYNADKYHVDKYNADK